MIIVVSKIFFINKKIFFIKFFRRGIIEKVFWKTIKTDSKFFIKKKVKKKIIFIKFFFLS